MRCFLAQGSPAALLPATYLQLALPTPMWCSSVEDASADKMTEAARPAEVSRGSQRRYEG